MLFLINLEKITTFFRLLFISNLTIKKLKINNLNGVLKLFFKKNVVFKLNK